MDMLDTIKKDLETIMNSHYSFVVLRDLLFKAEEFELLCLINPLLKNQLDAIENLDDTLNTIEDSTKILDN